MTALSNSSPSHQRPDGGSLLNAGEGASLLGVPNLGCTSSHDAGPCRPSPWAGTAATGSRRSWNGSPTSSAEPVRGLGGELVGGGRLVAEGSFGQLPLMRTRRVVGVDESCLYVPMTHPLLQRAHRHACGSHPGAERVP